MVGPHIKSMMKDQEYEEFLECLAYLTEIHDEYWVRVWKNEDGFYETCIDFNMNDVFYWGSADSEEFKFEDIELFEKARQECKDIGASVYYADLLWAARKRNLRPQGCILNKREEKYPGYLKLFEGLPEREVNLLNPYNEQGEYKYKKDQENV